MKKSFYVAAMAGLIFSACSNETYLGGDAPEVKNDGAIGFGTKTGAITRGVGNDTADVKSLEKYTDNFKVYGVKGTTSGSTTTYTPVFNNYVVKYSDVKSTSNTNDWEYVYNDQNIKYWDYATNLYKFWAITPAANATFTLGTDGCVASASIKAVSAQQSDVDAIFVAYPKVVNKTEYNKTVALTFKRLQARVRIGLYETVPGYKVSEVKFYTTGNVSTDSVTLKGSFLTKAGYTITFDNTNNTFSATADSEGKVTSNDLDFGAMTPLQDNTYLKESSTEASLTRYMNVLPLEQTGEYASASIKVDYTLTSIDSVGVTGYETIHVKGATAVIPAEVMKWLPNYSYTYLFKISDQTNGTTGDTTDPVGLYPITFDAAVEASEDNMEGYVTTVSEPSITTYQAGSATETGVKYLAGTAIDIYVMDGTSAVTFTEKKTVTISGPDNYSQSATSGTKVTIPEGSVKAGSYTVKYEDSTNADAKKTVTKIITVE